MKNKLECLLVSAKEASKLLGVSERWLWNSTAPRGKIPCVKLGDRVLYSPDELREYIRSRVVRQANST